MANTRIRNLDQESVLVGEHSLAVDHPSYNLFNAKRATLEDIKTFVWKVITDSGIIATITSDSNWDSDGDYIGSTVGLVAGDIYTDMAYRVRYEFDGNILIRYHINNVI
jgi:hypothetical protein